MWLQGQMKEIRKKISEQTQKFVDDNPDLKKTKTQKGPTIQR